jgi:hypothetical protein
VAKEFVGARGKSSSQASLPGYANLLKSKVLPLAAKQGTVLGGMKEWQDVFEIKDRRNEIAHPTHSRSFPPLTDELFFELVGSAVKMMDVLLGIKSPKMPGPFYMECNYDDLPAFFQWQ